MVTEHFENLPYRDGYVATGWIQYENSLDTIFDVWDHDFSCYTDGEVAYRCPLSLEEQVVMIIDALNKEQEYNASL